MSNIAKSIEVAAATAKSAIAILLLAALVVMGVGNVGKVEAVSTDTIKLLVTPIANYSVKITSPTDDVGFNFGSVDLNTISAISSSATVTNDGNATAKWELRADNSTNWVAGTSQSINTAVLQALFTAKGVATPVAVHFDNVNSSMTDTNGIATNTTRFSTTALSDMTSIATSDGNDQRQLYFRIKMPTESSVATQQTFRMYVIATQP